MMSSRDYTKYSYKWQDLIHMVEYFRCRILHIIHAVDPHFINQLLNHLLTKLSNFLNNLYMTKHFNWIYSIQSKWIKSKRTDMWFIKYASNSYGYTPIRSGVNTIRTYRIWIYGISFNGWNKWNGIRKYVITRNGAITIYTCWQMPNFEF